MKTARFVLAATLAFAITRLALSFHHPNWAGIEHEHCFVLTHPAVHQAVERQEGIRIPLGQIDPGQYRDHYHVGAGWIAGWIGRVVRWTGLRSLAAPKIVGLAHSLIFAPLFAWALVSLWPSGQHSPSSPAPQPNDPWRRFGPLVLVVLPPTLFLWTTLIPVGHYLETHVFYGLCLPPVVAWARGRGGWGTAIAAGVLSGLAAAYVLTFAVFGVAMLVLAALSGAGSWRQRVGRSALQAGVGVAVFLATANLGALRGRFADASQEVGGSPARQLAENIAGLWGRRVLIEGDGWAKYGLFSLIERGPGQAPGGLEVGLGYAFAAVAALGALSLLPSLVRLVHPRWRARMSAGERFLGWNALLLPGFLLPYLLLASRIGQVAYLIPMYVPVFVGIAHLIGLIAGRTPVGPRRRGAQVLAVAGTALLLAGWVDTVRHNASDRGQPDQGPCDSYFLDGYWRLPTADGAFPDRARGRARCLAANPDDIERCSLYAYLVDPPQNGADCARQPAASQEHCARAWGAWEHSWNACTQGFRTPLCEDVAPELRVDCLSGAFQGWRDSTNECWRRIDDRCREDFDGVGLSACLEGVGAMMDGQPALPAAPALPSARCARWPGPTQGLCARAEELEARPAPAAGQSCEAVYDAEYRDALPEGALDWDQCLSQRPNHLYRWCAIGVARGLGRTDCTWAGSWTVPDWPFTYAN